MIRLLIALVCACLAGMAARAQAPEARYALLIGNEDYPPVVGALRLPHEDVERVHLALLQAGIPDRNVTVLKDATQGEINLAIAEFALRLEEGGPEAVGFFYYSGHGGSAEVAGARQNYLIPAKTPVTSASQLPILGVPVSSVVDSLSAVNAKAVFIVSDACRNTLPLSSTKGGTSDKGMVRVPSRPGLYIAFATADGATAPDDGAFSTALANYLTVENRSVNWALREAMRDVARQRPGNQLPFSADSTTADVCFHHCSDGTGQLPSLASGERLSTREVKSLTGHRSYIYFAAYSPDGTQIATASADDTAMVSDVRSGQEVTTLRGHTGDVNSVAYSPDGKQIVTGSGDWTARVWDAVSGQPLATLSGHSGPIHTAAYGPDGTRIVTASEDGTVIIWDAESGQSLKTLDGIGDELVYSAAYSPDGSRILTASWGETAKVWDADSLQLLATLSATGDLVYFAAYSPDGTRIVTASGDGTARVWDASNWRLLETLSRHKDVVSSVAYSPDGLWIVTASWDGTAKVWDAGSGALLATLSGRGLVDFATFSPDGTRIVMNFDGNKAIIWELEFPD